MEEGFLAQRVREHAGFQVVDVLFPDEICALTV
jgi:hypothetical protein